MIWEESRENEREEDLVVSLLSCDVSQVSEVTAKVKVGPARLNYVIVEEALPMELERVRPFAGTGLGDIPNIQTGSDVGLFTFSTVCIYSKSRLVDEWTVWLHPLVFRHSQRRSGAWRGYRMADLTVDTEKDKADRVTADY